MKAYDGEVQGGELDGAKVMGLSMSAPPLLVLIVGQDGAMLLDSPAGLDKGRQLALAAQAVMELDRQAP